MLRFLTAGESHGPGLTAIIEGLPAGLPLSADDLNPLLERRQHSYGRGTRMKRIEKDRVSITGGIRNGMTIGSPLALWLENKDWQNRKDKNPPPRHVPRPGHADLAGAIKYRFDDLQNVIERASARETAIRTAVGAVAQRLLTECDIQIVGFVRGIGRHTLVDDHLSIADIRAGIDTSPVFCPDSKVSALMCEEIDDAVKAGDTLGGIFEVLAVNVPPGLGSYVHWDRKLDGRLAQAVMSIPSVKGVEFGPAMANAGSPGSQVHDPIVVAEGKPARSSNRAGGLEGGVTNGETIVVRGFAKPISSLRRPLPSVNLATKKATRAPYVRSDVCVVPAISVIAEALVAWVLADCFVEKFGGDSLAEMKEHFEHYQRHLAG